MTRTAKLAIAVFGAIALMLGGAVAYAQIPSSSGTITVCYIKSTGVMRIIDGDSVTCKKGETKLTWSQSGQPGAPGEDGQDGADGVSGHEIVSNPSLPITDRSRFTDRTATCPEGKKVTGGGASVATQTGGVTDGFEVLQDGPQVDNAWHAWFNIDNPNGIEFVYTVYAICAAVTP